MDAETRNRVVTGWATAQIAAGKSPDSTRTRRSYVRRWLMLDDAPTLASVDVFMATDGWTRETRRSAGGAIRSWLRWALRAGMDVPAPDLVDLPRSRRGRPHPAPDSEIQSALMRATPDEMLMLRLACNSGLRRA
ncbi:MAG: hypothetical protein RLZ55_1516, partial [Actinomycetota bacterium]